MKALLIAGLLMLATCASYPQSTKDKKVEMNAIEADLVQRIDYDLRHPGSEIVFWEDFLKAFGEKQPPCCDSTYMAFMERANNRIGEGLKNEKNLTDIITYHGNLEWTRDPNMNLAANVQMLRRVFPDLEDREIMYLLVMKPEGLKKCSHRYAQFMAQSDFIGH